MKKITIIIPVYNVERYIKKCLESVYAQDVLIDTYEVIVVNDGTLDNSMEIANEFADKYSNLIIYNQENKGLSEARNAGLKIAQGEYVWFVDSDDSIITDILGYIYNIIDENRDVDVFASVMSEFYERTEVRQLEKVDYQAGLFNGKDYIFCGCKTGATQRFIIKKEILSRNQLSFKKGIYHEDGEFNIRMLYLSSMVYIFDKPIYNYTIRESGSIMSSWKRKNSEDILLVYHLLKDFRNRYVDKNDISKFDLKICNILCLSISFAENNLYGESFKEFYLKNKKFIKRELRRSLKPFQYNFITNIKIMLQSLSPLYYFQITKPKLND